MSLAGKEAVSLQGAMLAEAIAGLAKRAADSEKAVNFAFGKVVQEYPLQVMLEQRLLLPEEQLILTENVIGAAVLRTDKEIYIREKIYDVFHNLEVGERVLLANVRGGQAWVILSKYYATELDELLEQNG